MIFRPLLSSQHLKVHPYLCVSLSTQFFLVHWDQFNNLFSGKKLKKLNWFVGKMTIIKCFSAAVRAWDTAFLQIKIKKKTQLQVCLYLYGCFSHKLCRRGIEEVLYNFSKSVSFLIIIDLPFCHCKPHTFLFVCLFVDLWPKKHLNQ